MMDNNDKVHVGLDQISNGFVVHRSWHEGKGKNEKYHTEDVFFDKLPNELEGLFVKGYMKKGIWADLKRQSLGDEEESEGEE